LQVLHRPRKAGLRSAYLAGFRMALNEGVEAIAQIDADLSHQPGLLPEMVHRLDACDVVLGSRYIEGGAVDRRWAPWRKRLSAFGNLYARTILQLQVRDLTTGYRVWRRETLLGMPLERVQASGYVFQVEMAYVAACLEYDMCELPIYFADRRHGSSKMSFRIQVEAALRVWQVWWNYRDLRRIGRLGRLAG
jgi:dolichol-phosphate mannosyltransferase